MSSKQQASNIPAINIVSYFHLIYNKSPDFERIRRELNCLTCLNIKTWFSIKQVACLLLQTTKYTHILHFYRWYLLSSAINKSYHVFLISTDGVAQNADKTQLERRFHFRNCSGCCFYYQYQFHVFKIRQTQTHIGR